jgi:hypothetical protein
MQKRITLSTSLLLVACTIITLASCFKDTATKQYKVYTPVYRTTQEVRDALKSDAPQPVSLPGKMYLFGNYIFLNEQNRGIHIIDNSNPSSPINKAFIHIPGNLDLAVKGNTLYADCYTDLFSIDITNINSVSLKNYLPDFFPERRYAYGNTSSNGKVIVDWQARDTIMSLEIREGQGLWKDGNLVMQGGLGGPWLANYYTSSSGSISTSVGPVGVGGSMARFTIIDNYMYAVTTSQLKTLNITNSNTPQLVGTKNVGWNIETIYPFKNKLFIGSQTGMYIFDLSNPGSPLQGMMFSHARACDPVIADDNYAYVTLHSNSSACWTTNNELNVVNIQNLSSPSLLKTYSLSGPKGLSKQGNILFICDGNAGLKIFDATDAANIELKKTIPMSDAYDVIALPNNIAIVSAKSGLYQYSFSSTTDVNLLSKISVQ